MPLHMQCQPPHNCVGLSAAAQRLLLYTNTAQGGEVGISESVAAATGALGLRKVLCWLSLTASKNTPFLPSSARQSYTASLPFPTRQRRMATIHSHWYHIGSTVAYLGSLAYCTTPGGAVDVTIISSIILLSDRGEP